MEVVNHKTGDKCYMKFEPYSYFGGTPKKVTGTVNSVDDKVNFFFFIMIFVGSRSSVREHYCTEDYPWYLIAVAERRVPLGCCADY